VVATFQRTVLYFLLIGRVFHHFDNVKSRSKVLSGDNAWSSSRMPAQQTSLVLTETQGSDANAFNNLPLSLRSMACNLTWYFQLEAASDFYPED
jgi:hypothetical protein